MRKLSVWSMWPQYQAFAYEGASMKSILDDVCKRRNLIPREVLSDARRRALSEARQEIMGLCFEAGKTTRQIGRFIGRDRSTVSYGAAAYRKRASDAA